MKELCNENWLKIKRTWYDMRSGMDVKINKLMLLLLIKK